MPGPGGLACQGDGARAWAGRRRVAGQADGVAFRVDDRGEGARRAVGGGRLEDLAAVRGDPVEGPAHVSYVDPDHRPGVPGRRTVLDPLADEAGSLEVRVVRFDLPAEDRLVERGRPLPVGRRYLQVADLAVNEAERPGSFGVFMAHGSFLSLLRHSTTNRPDDCVP